MCTCVYAETASMASLAILGSLEMVSRNLAAGTRRRCALVRDYCSVCAVVLDVVHPEHDYSIVLEVFRKFRMLLSGKGP